MSPVVTEDDVKTACKVVAMQCTDNIAVIYAAAVEKHNLTGEALHMQVLYILTNATYWRGELARNTKDPQRVRETAEQASESEEGEEVMARFVIEDYRDYDGYHGEHRTYIVEADSKDSIRQHVLDAVAAQFVILGQRPMYDVPMFNQFFNTDSLIDCGDIYPYMESVRRNITLANVVLKIVDLEEWLDRKVIRIPSAPTDVEEVTQKEKKF